MGSPSGLRPLLSTGVKERRLLTLLEGRKPEDLGLPERVEAAQVLGSLELSGFSYPFDEVLAAGGGRPGPPPLIGLFGALRAVDSTAPISVEALLLWHRALSGSPVFRFREEERSREDGPPPSPPRFIESRLSTLVEWLNAEAIQELKAPQVGALALARLVEILPFADGNGRLARLASSHLMVRAGARPPILVKGDGPALKAAVGAAFQLMTEPLASLLEEASGRSLDVMIQSLSSAR
ncbi:MAG TPA: Fic family protein [Vicinamibacteria bacterium]|jgi:hypothetical protein|nr:Fic family protein [Vicinamibacteria bacterium]